MTSIIYSFSINGELKYIGSSFEKRFETRKKEHRRKYGDEIIFSVIRLCQDEERFEIEGQEIDSAIKSGANLLNKFDPRKSFPNRLKNNGSQSKSITDKIIETKRRNGTLGNGGKKNKGRPSKFRGQKRPEISAGLLGKSRPNISAGLKLRNQIVREMSEFLGIDFKEAGIVRSMRISELK